MDRLRRNGLCFSGYLMTTKNLLSTAWKVRGGIGKGRCICHNQNREERCNEQKRGDLWEGVWALRVQGSRERVVATTWTRAGKGFCARALRFSVLVLPGGPRTWVTPRWDRPSSFFSQSQTAWARISPGLVARGAWMLVSSASGGQMEHNSHAFVFPSPFVAHSQSMVYLAPVSLVWRGSPLILHWGFAWRHDLAPFPAPAGWEWWAFSSAKGLEEGNAKSAHGLLELEAADQYIVL